MKSKRFLKSVKRKTEKRRKELNKAALIPSKVPKDQWTETTREKLLSKDNDAEIAMDNLLKQIDVRYRRERPIEANGKRFFIDFLVSSFAGEKVRVAIEVDGG